MKNNAITCSNKGWNTLALNHCMEDDLIEAIWILTFLRCLEAHCICRQYTDLYLPCN